MRGAITYPFQRGPAEFARLQRQGEFFADLTERFLRRAGIASARRVLDFGCGIGAVAKLVVRVCGEKVQVLGYDASAESIACARALPHGRRVHFVAELPPGRFDAIVGRMVLMYVPKPVQLLKRLRRLLKPGGILALQESDHRDYMVTRPASPLFEQWRERIMATGRRCGVRLDTAARLPALLAAAGFVVIERHGEESRVEHGADSPVHQLFADTALGMEWAMRGFELRNEPVPLDLASRLRSEARQCALAVHSSCLVGVTGRRP